MSESDGSCWRQHLGNILVGLIGAVGAIVAAVVPIVWNRSATPVAEPKMADNAAANEHAIEATAPSLVGTWDVVSSEGQTVMVTFDSNGKYTAGDRVGSWNQKGRKFTQQITQRGRIVNWGGEINLKGDEFTARNQHGLQVTGRKH
jgi:hypothetical protein